MALNLSSIGKFLMQLIESPAAGAESVQTNNTHSVTGGGFSLGNAGGWSNSFGEVLTQNYARRGITQTRNGVQTKHAVGDAAGSYTYVFTDGGMSAASDEGATAITGQVIEPSTWFHGTVSTTTGTGDTAPVLAHTSGSAWTTDGGYLLNISKGTLSGTLTGASAPLSLTINSGVVSTFLNRLTVSGVSLPLSTAVGIATAPIAPGATTRDVPLAVTVTVNLAQIGGIFKLFTNGSVVTVAGNQYPEQSIVSAATGLLAGNQQSFTLLVTNPNAQAVIFQGGIQGQYISADANTMRSAYFAFGSLTGTDMIYGNQVAGGVANHILPNAGCEAWQATGANSAWHLYPGMEVVKNTDQGFACVGEQNRVAWAASDVVECARFPTSGGTGAFFVRTQYMPSNSGTGMSGLFVLLNGPGISGGNSNGVRVQNQQTPSTYAGAGGPLSALNGIAIMGVFANSIYIDTAPDQGSNAILFVQSNNTAASNRVSVVNLDFAGGGEVSFDVAAGRWHVDKMDSTTFSASGAPGINATIATAKLTSGGTNGSMTFAGGILTAQTPAT